MAAPAPAAPPTLHRGWVVKQVNSGDTIVLKGRPRGGPPPERTVILSHIQAPKLGRRPMGQDEATLDEVGYVILISAVIHL